MAGSTSWRAGAVALGAVALCGGSAATFTRLAVASWHRVVDVALADPADLVLLVLCLAGLAMAGWLGLATTASALARLPGSCGVLAGRVGDRLAPAVVRRVVAVLAGTAVAAAVAPGTAVAAQHRPGTTTTATAVVGDASPSGGLPDPGFHPLTTRGTNASPVTPTSRPTPGTPTTDPARVVADPVPDVADPAPSEPGFRPHPPRTTRTAVPIDPLARPSRPGALVEEHYVVRGGDTLWDLAARHLGPGATPAQIAAEWPRWYAANRASIGPDPDLIHPGQRLVPPMSALAP